MFHRKISYLFSSIRKYSSSLTVKELLSLKPINKNFLVQGWVQAVRKHKDVLFVDLVDGSVFKCLQVVMEDGENSPKYASSIEVKGTLVESKHKGQEVELICSLWNTIGACDEDYPFHNRLKYLPDYVRQFPHLRSRTYTFRSVFRARSCASYAVYNFFQKHGFFNLHTPIYTLNDCEGAGEVFTVKTHLPFEHSEQDDSDEEESVISNTEGSFNVSEINAAVNPSQNSSNEFFGSPVFLTVSAQLHLEAGACSLSRVFNFGPVFRAEHSRSRQHASEFHMIEAEMAFVNTVEELEQIVEKLVKDVAQSILIDCSQDFNWLCKNSNKTHKSYVEKVIFEPFPCMTYTEAVNLIQSKKGKLKKGIKWGEDFSAEHKRFLVKHCNNLPVVINMFPGSLKPFYMKEDRNGMVYCFDIFAPFGGEICGGGLREHDFNSLKCKLENKDNLSWYLDLRKYGTVPHGGFGIGFDRLLMCILGIPDIRDVIPFPRRRNHCKC